MKRSVSLMPYAPSGRNRKENKEEKKKKEEEKEMPTNWNSSSLPSPTVILSSSITIKILLIPKNG
jgi:hypothetical protein